MKPTSGAGLVMRPDPQGRYAGRLVFCPVRNAYQGDIPIWSDDGGRTFNFSTELYLPGLDECNIAQAANGSLYLISRNCLNGDLSKCQMTTDDAQQQQGRWRGDSVSVSDNGMEGEDTEGLQSRGTGEGDHHFVYSISNDGGATVRTAMPHAA